MNAGRAQGLPTQVLHSMTRDKASRFHRFRSCLWGLFPWEKRAGEGMGGLGGRLARTLFSLRCETAGPSRAGGDRKARCDCGKPRASTATRGDPPSPRTGSEWRRPTLMEKEERFRQADGSALPRASSPSAVPSSSRHHQRARRQSRSMSPPAATLSICRY